MLKIKEMTPDITGPRIGHALKQYVGRGRDYSYAEFAQAINVEKGTLENWCQDGKTPTVANLLRCMMVLPPEFANSILSLAGLCGAYEEGGSSSSVEVNVKAAELVSLISVHLQDMKIDHRELAEQVPLVRELHTICGAFLKEHERSGGTGS